MRWRDQPVELALPDVDAYLRDAEPRLAQRVADGLQRAEHPVVHVKANAREDALRHVGTSPLERGGLLVGRAFRRPSGEAVALVEVRAAVPAVDDDATAISLRMEARVWSEAGATLRPGEIVVGWFHSHPGIGAFFSDTDRRTQGAFFRMPYSLGWVIDPLRGEEAWFVGAAALALPRVAVAG